MALVVGDDSPNQLPSDSIPIVDLRFFSQSELTSLSLCSEKAFDLRSCSDVIIPKIDRSVFNESAGSRKQTYSRLRLAPRKPEISAVGRGRYNPVSKPHTNPVDDPERKENKQIVSILRGLFGKDTSIQFKQQNNNNLEIVRVHNQPVIAVQPLAQIPGGVVKRKRGRPRKDGRDLELPLLATPPKPKLPKESHDFYENAPRVENVVMEIVNKNGVVVDLAVLASSEDPYGPQLRNRTAGLASEEDLAAFMRQLKGQWGSRRKKRKVVDACDFGDALPIGWKLLLSLRKKEGILSLYCRRYISPTGQQFVSCKEVSSYLLPFFGFQSENHSHTFDSDESNDEAYKLSSGSSAGLGHRAESTKDEIMQHEASPIESFSSEHEKFDLLGTENLAEVEVRDLLECHICKRNFDEKDVYLEHLLSSHQRSAKRARSSGTSVCDGVIINDGKFECQFCHKIFDEKHRYNGHVGVHVRNQVRGIEVPSGGITMHGNFNPSSVNGVLSGFSVGETSSDIDKYEVTPPSVPSSETAMEDMVKPSSGSRVLPGSSGVDNVNPSSNGVLPGCSVVETSTDIDKVDVQPTSVPSSETVMEDKVKPSSGSIVLLGSSGEDVKPSSVNGVLPAYPVVETLTNIDKVDILPTSVPSSETAMEDKVKPPSGSRVLPGSLGVEVSDDAVKSCVPSTFTSGDENIIQHSSKPSLVSGLLPGFPSIETSEKDFVPPSSVRASEAAMLDIEMSSGSGVHPEFPEAGELADINKSSVQSTSAPSTEMNTDPSCDKLDMDGSTSKLENEQSGHHNGQSHGVDIPKSFLVNPDVADVDALQDNLVSGTNVENSTSVLNFEHRIGSPCSKQDIVADKIGIVMSGRSGDKQESDIEISGDKLGSIGNNTTNVDFSSCLDSAASLYNDVEDSGNEAMQENNVFKSTIDGKSQDIDHPNNDLDSDFNSCLGSVNVSALDNVENGNGLPSNTAINIFGLKQGQGSFGVAFTPCNEKTKAVETLKGNNVIGAADDKVDQATDDLDGDFSSCLRSVNAPCGTLEDGNVPTTSTVGINMFGLKPGESSFGFAFASSCSQKTNAFESFRRRDVTNTTVGKIDQATNNLDGDFRSCFGSLNASSRDDVENANVPTSSTIGINMFGLKQREGSFGFAYPSSCSEKANAVDFQGNDFSNTRDDKVDQTTNDLNGDFKSCFGTTNLRANVENGNTYERNSVFSNPAIRSTTSGLKQGEGSFSFSFTPSGRDKTNDIETFKGKDILTGTDRKWAKVDQTNNYVDGGFRSCLEAALHDNEEDGMTVTCEGNNIFTSTTVGTNISSLKQGGHSFSFLFAPSGSERNNGVGTFENNDVFAGTTGVKPAKVHHTKNDVDGGFGSYLESATAFRDNVGSGANLPYGGNNAFTSTVGSNMSGPKHGERSLSFSFAPLGSGKTSGVDFCTDGLFSSSMKKPELDRRREYGFIEQERCYGTNTRQPSKDVLLDSADKETMLQRLGIDTPSPMLQSSGCFPTLDLMSLMSNKEQVESQNFPLQKYENMSGFEDLGFDDLEPSKFGFVTGEANSLAQGHMDLGYDSVMEEALNNSVQFDWEPMAPKMDGGSTQQQSTQCVWCRMPFNHEAINSEMQSDSVGFMCPSCKAKISGQLSIGSSFNWL